MKIASSEHFHSEHAVRINCSECQNKKQIVYTCSELVIFMYWAGKSMDHLLSYCGLVDAKISASEKDLPALNALFEIIPTSFSQWNSWEYFIENR